MHSPALHPILRIGTFESGVHGNPGPVPLCITAPALATLLATVGARRPETGAMLLGPERFGIDFVEFDERGSAQASASVYRPDAEWRTARIRHHGQSSSFRLWTGDAHSHPNGMGRPSGKAGPGLGDLGQVESIFEAVPDMEWFALPILTGAGTDEVTIWPWLCERTTTGVTLYLANMEICDADLFPERRFNPALAEHIHPSADSDRPDLDVFLLSRLLSRPIEVAYRARFVDLIARAGNGCVIVRLPQTFPTSPPRMRIGQGKKQRDLVFTWSSTNSGPSEPRLAKLFRRGLSLAKESF
jgi:hypothetical protein